MTWKEAAQTQHEPGLARTLDPVRRAQRPAPKTTEPRSEATTPGPAQAVPGTGTPLPPPHPALVELVRLLARADARRARSEERGTQ
jgi:hypothetical protein